MKYAVIGQGFIWPRHKKGIKDSGGKVLLTCDPEKPAQFKNWMEMFNSPKFKKVDTVVILTPNYLHGSMVREALRRGKKVLCEKPLVIDNNTDGLEGVNTILQLRYNPNVEIIKKSLKEDNHVKITVKTYREPEYWKSWKGQPHKSGGILYNMGIHYIDLLIHLLGNPVSINGILVTDTTANGSVQFENGVGEFIIELHKEPMATVREILVNGQKENIEGATIPLFDGTQLEYQNLHSEVYKHFVNGEGIPLSEAKKSLQLVHDLLHYAEKN